MKVLQNIISKSMLIPRVLNRNKIVIPIISYSSCRCFHEKNINTSRGIPLQHIDISNNFSKRFYSSSETMPLNKYTDIVNDTLEDIADNFENLADDGFMTDDFDCILADGVLTANLGQHGVYVINKQTPNRQIWLSSPISGPKRYDFVDNTWCYNHEDMTLHELLNIELSELLETDVDFTNLAFGKK